MVDDSDEVNQDAIEDLLRQAQDAASSNSDTPATPTGTPAPGVPRDATGAAASAAPTATASAAEPGAAGDASSLPGDDVELLLTQAEQALASVEQPHDAAIEGLRPFSLSDFSGTPATAEKATLDLLRDVELDLKIELGRTQMQLEDVLLLRRGSVVPLDRLAGDLVNIYVNGRLVARGEVLVLNDNFCVRVAELISGDDLDRSPGDQGV